MNFSYFIYCSIIILSLGGAYFGRKIEFLMPNVRPMMNDQQLTIGKKIAGDKTEYLIDIKMKFDTESVHHIAVFCSKYLPEKFTNILNYQMKSNDLGFIGAVGIGHDPLVITEGFGYKFGENALKYLILHVHYNNSTRYQNGETDNSGVIITMAPSVRKESNNLLIMPSFPKGYLQPHKKGYIESVFHIEQDIVAHILQVWIHTHSLGKVVSGYIIRNGEWKLILKGDPLAYKSQFSVEDKNLTMKRGDIFAIRCTYFNDRDEVVSSGFHTEDEMCMYQIHYYVEGEELLKKGVIFENVPWKNDIRIKALHFIEDDSETLD